MIAAYCWPQSAKANEEIVVYCHTEAKSFQYEIVRQGIEDKTVLSETNISGRTQNIADNIAEQGCDWDPTFVISIDPDWRAGLYLVRLEDSDGRQTEAFFVVRAVEPTDAMLVLSTSTWNAYNTWGGLSYYTGGYVVSPMRPLQPGFLTKTEPYRNRIARFKQWTSEDREAFFGSGYDPWTMAAGWSNWERLFVNWAEQEGYNLNYAVSQDLDQYPNLLDGHPVYISVGHDEYWSAAMRDTVEKYIDSGGNAAFFSGNTSFWQARFNGDYRQMTSYKCQIKDDPVYHPEHAPTLSTMWCDPLVGRPESEMTGVSFTRGGYAHMPNAPDGTGGYSICQPNHWVFQGTSLRSGDTLGGEEIIVGYECDGCEFKNESGKLVPTYEDDTPKGFEILGTAPAHLWETQEAPGQLAENYIGELNWVAERIGGADTPAIRERFASGNAVMGTFRRGAGEVFTSGCTDWAYGLTNEMVSRVTNNILSRFIQAQEKPS